MSLHYDDKYIYLSNNFKYSIMIFDFTNWTLIVMYSYSEKYVFEYIDCDAYVFDPND